MAARLAQVLHRTIDWKVIEDNYDLVMKYAAAIDSGTSTAEAVLLRFRGAVSHQAYQAMLEIGKAQRMIFICRYLCDRDLQRQIEEGLNVVERLEPRKRGDRLRQVRGDLH